MSESITPQEARKLALKVMEDAEEQRRKSYEAEARFEQAIAFSQYGEPALLFMIDKGCDGGGETCSQGLTEEEFEAKYGATKREVNFLLICLQIALEKKDYAKRNEYYDCFIKLLAKV
jgi:hypothetical protein